MVYGRGIVLAVVKVEGDVEEVCNLEVAVDGDFQAEILERLRDVLPDSVSSATGDVLEGSQAIVPIQSYPLLAMFL